MKMADLEKVYVILELDGYNASDAIAIVKDEEAAKKWCNGKPSLHYNAVYDINLK